jgi:hypothetical protein
LKLQELAAMDSKRWFIGCRDVFQAGVLGVVIAALIVWFFPGRMTGGDGIFADPGRKANFLLGLLVLGSFGFVVGSIIGAVIAALGIRSAATRKSVADEPGPVAYPTEVGKLIEASRSPDAARTDSAIHSGKGVPCTTPNAAIRDSR